MAKTKSLFDDPYLDFPEEKPIPQGNVICGDSLKVLRQIEADSVQTCITSPPYWGLRDYGIAGQIGAEMQFDQYITNLVSVFREVRRVLRRDGTLWLNMGIVTRAAEGSGGKLTRRIRPEEWITGLRHQMG